MFLALQNPSYLTERPPLKKLYIPIICCYFSISHPLRCHCSYRPHHFITVPFSFLCLSTCLQRRQSIAPPEGTISAILLHVQKRKTITVLFFFFFFVLGIMAKQDWYLFWNDYSFIHKSCPENLAHFASPQAHYCRKRILNSLFFFFLSFNFGSSSRSFRFITRALFPILIFGKEKC